MIRKLGAIVAGCVVLLTGTVTASALRVSSMGGVRIAVRDVDNDPVETNPARAVLVPTSRILGGVSAELSHSDYRSDTYQLQDPGSSTYWLRTYKRTSSDTGITPGLLGYVKANSNLVFGAQLQNRSMDSKNTSEYNNSGKWINGVEYSTVTYRDTTDETNKDSAMTMSFLGGFRWGVVSIGGLISETPEHTATDTTTRTQINHDPQQTFLQEETITETESKEKSSNRAMKCGVMVTLAEDTLDAVVSITHNKLTTTSETTNDAKTISFLYNHHCNNAVALGVNVEQTTSDGSTDTDNYRSAKHDSTTRNIGVGVAVTPLESTIIGIDLVQKHASRNSQAFNSIGQTVLDGDSSFDNLSLSIGAEFWTLQHTLAIRMGGTKSIASRRSYQDESATMRTEVSSKEGSDGDDILTAGLGWKMSERWLLEYGITMQGTATQEALVTVTF